jgi:hypothetical protein
MLVAGCHELLHARDAAGMVRETSERQGASRRFLIGLMVGKTGG